MPDLTITPRIIRMKVAPGYLGMSLRVFNASVRPLVREFKVGDQGVGFLRDDLDQWADNFAETNAIDKKECPSADQQRYQNTLCYKCECRKAEILKMVTEGWDNCPEIARKMGIGRSTAFKVLDELREEGQVVTTGVRRNTRWYLAKNRRAA